MDQDNNKNFPPTPQAGGEPQNNPMPSPEPDNPLQLGQVFTPGASQPEPTTPLSGGESDSSQSNSPQTGPPDPKPQDPPAPQPVSPPPSSQPQPKPPEEVTQPPKSENQPSMGQSNSVQQPVNKPAENNVSPEPTKPVQQLVSQTESSVEVPNVIPSPEKLTEEKLNKPAQAQQPAPLEEPKDNDEESGFTQPNEEQNSKLENRQPESKAASTDEPTSQETNKPLFKANNVHNRFGGSQPVTPKPNQLPETSDKSLPTNQTDSDRIPDSAKMDKPQTPSNKVSDESPSPLASSQQQNVNTANPEPREEAAEISPIPRQTNQAPSPAAQASTTPKPDPGIVPRKNPHLEAENYNETAAPIETPKKFGEKVLQPSNEPKKSFADFGQESANHSPKQDLGGSTPAPATPPPVATHQTSPNSDNSAVFPDSPGAPGRPRGHFFSPDQAGGQPAFTQNKKGLSKSLKITVAAVTSFILIFGGLLAYLNLWAPRTAFASYFGHIAKAKSAAYSGNIKFETETSIPTSFTEISPANYTIGGDFDIAGAYTLKDDKPLGNMGLDGSLDFNGLSSDLKANFVANDEDFYFQLEKLGVLSALGFNISNDWYKTSYKQDLKDEGSDCSDEENQKILEYLGKNVFSSDAVSIARKGLLWEKVDGKLTSHYTGTVDIEKFMERLQGLNDVVSEKCIPKDDFKVSDQDKKAFEKTEISFDLYSSSNFDKITMSVKTDIDDTKTSFGADMTFKDYGKEQNITIPADAKPFNESTFLQNNSLDSYGSDSFTPTSNSSSTLFR